LVAYVIIGDREPAETERQGQHVPEWEVRSGTREPESDRHEKTQKQQPTADELDDWSEEQQRAKRWFRFFGHGCKWRSVRAI